MFFKSRLYYCFVIANKFPEAAARFVLQKIWKCVKLVTVNCPIGGKRGRTNWLQVMISYIYATVVVSYYLLVKELVTRKLKFQVCTPSFFAKIFDTFFQVVNKVWPLKILQVSPKMNTIFFQRYTWKLNKRYPFRNPVVVVVVVVTHTLIKVALGGIFKIVFSRQICEPVLLKRVVWFEKRTDHPNHFP